MKEKAKNPAQEKEDKDTERDIDVEGLLGKTPSRSDPMATDIRSSLGNVAEFKLIDLSKCSGEAMKCDRKWGRRGWTGIAREPLRP